VSIKRFLKAFACAVGTLTIGISTVGFIESLPPDIKPAAVGGVVLFLAVCALTWSFYQSFDD
jgi:hypothetical protein